MIYLVAAMMIAVLGLASLAAAHQGEKHVPPVAAQPAPAGEAPGDTVAPDMSNMDMSGMDMSGPGVTWPTDDGAAMTMPGMMKGQMERPKTFAGRLIRWLGAWHPAVVHFPIALLLTVAFLETAAFVRRTPIYNAANKILLALGVVSAFVAAPLGWVAAGIPAPDDELVLTIHRWLGSAIPFLLLFLWRLKPPAVQAAVRPSPALYEGLLAITVLSVLGQAFLGAVLTHGAEHLAF